MSTDWGLGCEDCGVFEEYDNCRNVEALSKIVECAPQIVAAANALDAIGGPDIAINLSYGVDWNMRPVEFVTTMRLKPAMDKCVPRGPIDLLPFNRASLTVRFCHFALNSTDQRQNL